jgi:putative exosortase-associated protein (TIGR04073 family)
MKKVLVLLVAMLIAFAPLSFANWACESAGSDIYLKAAGGKLLRGIGNAAFGWTELIRQPMIQENKWEGVSRGVGHAILRTLSGAVEAVTCLVPKANIPAVEPVCPTDMFKAKATV